MQNGGYLSTVTCLSHSRTFQNGSSLALVIYMTCFQVEGCTLVMWYDDNSHIIHFPRSHFVNKVLSHSIHNSHVSSLPFPSLSPFHGASLLLTLCSSL